MGLPIVEVRTFSPRRCHITRTAIPAARATRRARLRRIAVERVLRVEPEHVRRMVVPQRKHEHHPVVERLAHARHAPAVREGRVVVERGLLLRAELVRDRIELVHALDGGLGVLDDLPVLDVDAPDLGEVAIRGAVGGDELGDNGDRLGGVDNHVRAVETGVAHAVRVEVTTSLGALMRQTIM